jgi:photosystem II stability/assembly factor-like uncharacterized protein
LAPLSSRHSTPIRLETFMTHQKSFFPAFALLLLVSGGGHAGINTWTLTGPEGGEVNSVAVHPTDPSVVLASGGNGIYRSADGGVTWTRTGAVVAATDIIFDPANASRIFALAKYSSRLYRSDDAGLTFAAVTGPANASPYRFGISGNSTLYMADRMGRTYRSADLGAIWTEVGLAWTTGDEVVTAIAVDRANANVLYVAVKDVGTFKSIDGGTSWGSPLTNGPGSAAQSQVYQLAIKPDDSSRILGAASDGSYVSIDAGLNWSHSSSVLPRAFAFNPATNNNVVAVGWLGQIARSSDGGLTWPTGAWGANLQVMQSPRIALAPPDKVIVATSDGPMVSTDGGVTFTRNASGMHVESPRFFSSTDNGTTYATFLPGPFGVYRREGAGWLPVDNDELRSRLNFPYLISVAVAPGNANRLFVVGGSNQLVSSFDGGQSWSPPHAQFNSGSPYLVRAVIDPTDQQIVYLLTQSAGVFKSVDGGGTFTPRTTGLPAGINALTIDRTNTQILYAGGFFSGTTGVFKSINGGLSWQPTATLPDRPVYDIVIDPANSTVVYAVLGTEIQKSINGGVSWAPMTFGTGAIFGSQNLFFERGMPTTMYVSTTPNGPGLSRSIDAGATWEHISTTGVLPSTGLLETMSPDGIFTGNFFAGGIGTGLYEYHIANDLRVNFTAPLSFALGATGTLQIPIQNAGPYHAASPELHFNIPSNITITVPAGCRYVSPAMVCTLPSIRSGETLNFMLPYSASATPGNLAMGLYLFGREVELAPNDNQPAIPVNVLAMADLGVTTTGTASVQRDEPLTYSATITNSGPNASAVTTLVVQVPSGISLQTRTPSVGTCTAAGSSTTCELGVLASGASATVSFTGTALIAGPQAWSSTVTTGAQDLVAANNVAQLTTTITTPPPPSGGGSSSGGGGGRFDWLAALLLGALILKRCRAGKPG